MKKVSILLVVILIGALSVTSLAASDSATTLIHCTVISAIDLTVLDGAAVEFGNVEPGVTYTEDDATTLKVKAPSNLGWNLTKSKTMITTVGGLTVDALTVDPETMNGTGGDEILVDYTLDVPWNVDTGGYTIEVTFTISA